MRLDWIFLPRENPCARFYIIIIIVIVIVLVCGPLYYVAFTFETVPFHKNLDCLAMVINLEQAY